MAGIQSLQLKYYAKSKAKATIKDNGILKEREIFFYFFYLEMFS